MDNHIRVRKGAKATKYDVVIRREGKILRKTFDTVEEAETAVKNFTKFVTHTGHSYPESIIEYLFGDDPTVDIAAVESHFDEAFRNLLLEFSEREQTIAKARIIDGYTMQAVGEQLGITTERVRQIEAKFLRKLKVASRLHRLRYGDEVVGLLERVADLKSQLLHTESTLLSELEKQDGVNLRYANVGILDLPTRGYNILRRSGISTIDELLQLTEWELRRLRGCGAEMARLIVKELAVHGYKLRREES